MNEIRQTQAAYGRLTTSYDALRAQARKCLFEYEDLSCVHKRHRETLRLLKMASYHPMFYLHILEVGYDDGNMLA